jgi:hypothetical protein
MQVIPPKVQFVQTISHDFLKSLIPYVERKILCEKRHYF